jgi:hypothetical protein
MVALYRWLLRLYPTAYRCEFGEEMLAGFLEAKKETWAKGIAARAAFCAREVEGLLRGALQERLRVATGSDFLESFHVRRFVMRSEYKFPKATALLMAIILAIVVITIEKAKALSAALPHTGPQLPPIPAAQLTIIPTLLVVLVAAGVAGALGWAILFAMRRSGIQQFSESKGIGKGTS